MEHMVDSIEFKPAEGGLVSHTEKLEKPGKHDFGMHKREIGVHTTMASAVKHMKKHLGHHFGKKESKRGEVSMKKD